MDVKIPKKFDKNKRHIRWNWEKSPDSEETVRYHLIIVDDRFRESKLEKIKINFREETIINYPFEEIRSVGGKVKGTPFRYLFVSYDTIYSPSLLSFKGISENVKKDLDLRERKRGNIEDYVANLYEID